MEKKTHLCLRPDEAIDAALRRVFGAFFDNAAGHLRASDQHRDAHIHAARTTIKQVRALLRLIRPAIGDRVFRRENRRLQKTARLLAPMRETAVGIQTFRNLVAKAHSDGERSQLYAAAAHFVVVLGAQPSVGREKAIRAAVRSLEGCRRRLDTLPLASIDPAEIERGLLAVYRACRRRMKRSFATGEDIDFHRWRIRLKNLYYELQFLMPLWPHRFRTMISQLKELQELIGDDHDLAMLRAALQKAPPRPGSRRAVERTLRRFEKYSEKLRRASQPLAERLLEEKPRPFVRKLERHWKSRR